MRNYISGNNRYGFTLIEILFSLSITLIIVFSIFSVYRIIQSNFSIYSYNEDIYLSVKQISEYLIGSVYVESDSESYTYQKDNKIYRISYNDHRLIKEPGFEILAFNIDSFDIDIKDELVYFNIERNDQRYHLLVGYIYEEEKQ